MLQCEGAQARLATRWLLPEVCRCAWSAAAEASTTNASQCSLTMNFALWEAVLEANKELESLKA